MLHFNTRTQARQFAIKRANYKTVDLGKGQGKRWGVQVVGG